MRSDRMRGNHDRDQKQSFLEVRNRSCSTCALRMWASAILRCVGFVFPGVAALLGTGGVAYLFCAMAFISSANCARSSDSDLSEPGCVVCVRIMAHLFALVRNHGHRS